MARLVLTFLLSISLSSAADATISSTRTISEGKSTTFSLPESKALVLALTSVEDVKINYKYHAQGRLIASDTCNDCYEGSLWVPFLMITEEWIERYDSDRSWFHENIEPSQARNLSLENKSSSPVELQVFTLPLENSVPVTIPLGGRYNFTLPEEEEVWLALGNDQEDTFLVTFDLCDETGTIGRDYSALVEKGWLIIRIYTRKIMYGPNNHILSKHGLKRRRLELQSPNSLKCQLFSMPLEPKDANEQTDAKESADTNVTLILIFVVSLIILLLLAATCLGYRFCWKKREKELREGSPRVTAENSRTVTGAGGLTKQNSSHDSENSLYGASMMTHGDVTRQNSAHDSENSLYVSTVR